MTSLLGQGERTLDVLDEATTEAENGELWKRGKLRANLQRARDWLVCGDFVLAFLVRRVVSGVESHLEICSVPTTSHGIHSRRYINVIWGRFSPPGVTRYESIARTHTKRRYGGDHKQLEHDRSRLDQLRCERSSLSDVLERSHFL